MASAESEIDQELRNKIPGQPVTGVVQCKRCRAYVGRAGDADEAIPRNDW